MDKYLNKIEKQENGCWVWKGNIHQSGYGIIYLDGKKIRAHRYFYEHFKGKIGYGLYVDHLCNNRPCVNPDHLEAVTARENTLRGNGVSGINLRKTHCVNGHELKGENLRLYWDKRHGSWARQCRICRRASTNAWKKRAGYSPFKPYKRQDGTIR